MGIPVNRLKIMAFSFGAGIAGLAGSHLRRRPDRRVPAELRHGRADPIYAVVILGGTGSLTGMIVGAIVIIASNQVLDSTSPPNLAARALLRRPDRGRAADDEDLAEADRRPGRDGRRSASSLHAIVGAVWSNGTKGEVTSGGFLGGAIKHWVLIPADPHRLAVCGYLLLIVCVIVLVAAEGLVADRVLVPTLYLPRSSGRTC